MQGDSKGSENKPLQASTRSNLIGIQIGTVIVKHYTRISTRLPTVTADMTATQYNLGKAKPRNNAP
jgi:hypothetical protein